MTEETKVKAPKRTRKTKKEGEYTLIETISKIVGNRVIHGEAGDKVQLTPAEAKAMVNLIK